MAVLGKLIRSTMDAMPPEVAMLSQGKTPGEQHLSKIFRTVIHIFLSTLEESRLDRLVPKLNAVEPELRGFAYEGAALGLMALDCVFPWKKRFQALVAGPGSPYIYPAYVGAGVALARLGKQPERYLAGLDPVLGWMVIDGSGFRCALFARAEYIESQKIPEHLSAYARRVFDQGMGRGIWFFNGADIERVKTVINAFAPNRRADMWSGVAFACAYAGGAGRADIELLQASAEPYKLQLARGAAVGAKGRQRAGNMAPHTELTCQILCGLSANEAASITDNALQDLPLDGDEPAYEIWRQRIEAVLATPLTDYLSEKLQPAHSIDA